MQKIYIVFAETDWPRVLPLARNLDAHGYQVGPSKALDFPDRPAKELTEADADCVIVVWSKTSTSSAALHYAARTASSRNALVEIRMMRALPEERYLNLQPIDFSTWEHTIGEGAWRALMRRLRPICGPPPRRPLDVVETTPRVLIAGVSIVSLLASAAALNQSAVRDNASTSALQQPSIPAPPLQGEDLSKAEADAKPIVGGLGGPEYPAPQQRDESGGYAFRETAPLPSPVTRTTPTPTPLTPLDAPQAAPVPVVGPET